jgi:hypothetical protein
MKDPLAQRAKEHQDARGCRRHPAPSDPKGGSDDGNAERQGNESKRRLADSERKHCRTLGGEPAEGRTLVEP